ncbi:MAG: metal ABC transporter permease [Gemmatimonadetes bacterium]|nr:metal ABC transporter permease [Gemmatimonadota bacterium]
MLDLILTPTVCALVILLAHAYFGLHIIKRGIIFVDLALAQIAALGSTVAVMVGFHAGTPTAYAFAYAFTLIGGLIFSFSRMEDSPVPQEAIIGITFVVASATVILLASFSAEGAEQIKETLTGTLIWVTWADVLKILGAYVVVTLFHYVFRRPMLAISFTPERQRHLRLWDFLFYASFGFVITMSVPVAGVLMVFSVLVIPAVIAFLYTRRFLSALLLAWASGTVAIVGGITVSFLWDVTTGPLLVCAFGAALILAAAIRPLIVRGRARGIEVPEFLAREEQIVSPIALQPSAEKS